MKLNYKIARLSDNTATQKKA